MRPLCGLYALTAVDGTAAGDAFSGALLAAALTGLSAFFAGSVHRGADPSRAADIIQDLSGVAFEIANRWIDLGKRYSNRVHEKVRSS